MNRYESKQSRIDAISAPVMTVVLPLLLFVGVANMVKDGNKPLYVAKAAVQSTNVVYAGETQKKASHYA